MRRVRGFTLIELLIVVAIIAIVAATAVPNFLEAQARSQADAPWIFVSMPDFVNVDTEYPQKGWEDALGFILEAVRAEKPDFILVAGDLLMGHWGADPAKINQCADKYYAAWKKRLAAHGLTFYAALGDHEIADNPWRTPDRIRAVAVYKEAFRRWLGMPLNGPEHMKGTAYWFAHKNTLFVSVDVFEAGTSDQGGIAVGVTGPQLEWLERVLSQNRDVNHVIVMGHAPILGPLTMWSSSGQMVEGGRESPLWQALKKHNADLYLCGEVHAITCIERDGVQQVAHGGLIGYNTRTNYLVARVFGERIELELKEIDMLPRGEHLWQEGTNRPLETVTIPEEIKKQGFVTVGRLVIEKSAGRRTFRAASGYFAKEHEPRATVRYGPVFRSEKGPAAPPRLSIKN